MWWASRVTGNIWFSCFAWRTHHQRNRLGRASVAARHWSIHSSANTGVPYDYSNKCGISPYQVHKDYSTLNPIVFQWFLAQEQNCLRCPGVLVLQSYERIKWWPSALLCQCAPKCCMACDHRHGSTVATWTCLQPFGRLSSHDDSAGSTSHLAPWGR